MTRTRIIAARLVAIGADLLQLGLFPFFGEGIMSALNDFLDVAVCLALTVLVGWHFSFLPSFMLELVPLADVIPTWTLAVFFATRQKQSVPTETTVVDVETNPPTPRMEPAPPKLLPSKARQDV